MTSFAKAREAAAARIAVREHGGEFQTPEQNWAQMNAYQKKFAYKIVDAALSAFEEAGFVLVPKEATPKMKECVAFGDYTTTSYGDEYSTFDYFSEDNAADVWSSMVAQAKIEMSEK